MQTTDVPPTGLEQAQATAVRFVASLPRGLVVGLVSFNDVAVLLVPPIAVTVGDCLTYLYDRDALAAHVPAWRETAAHNQSLRLPTAPAVQVAGPDRTGGRT
jgi:hypothetical protein